MNRVDNWAAPIFTNEVTVLEGSSFCRSDRTGNIHARRAQGIFIKDTRIISTWELFFDDEPLEPLGVVSAEPFEATFFCRAASRGTGAEASVVVTRHRMIADDLREDIVVRNYGVEPCAATLLLAVDGDFADLFDVKDGRAATNGGVRHHVVGGDLHLTVTRAGHRRGVRVSALDGAAARGALTWRLTVPAHDEWRTTVRVLPSDASEETVTSFPLDRSVETTRPSRRMRDWWASTPRIECDDPTLQQAIERSVADLGSLRITDPAHPELDVVAAGSPWFMTLFGRDSLLTSSMALPWDPSLARGTLHTLARLQGDHVDLSSEEEPGKILHEVRRGLDESRALGGSAVYYGSVDATPLFVMLLDRAARWGLADSDLTSLLPAADRALSWIEDYGDLDGDGFVEYQRRITRGLVNQGWKDSHDAISDRHGRLAHGPIALAEVQGYVYAAYRARAHLAVLVGDAATARRCERRADELRARFNEAFWLADLGYYALALDGDKRPVDALASNQGHCLWTGIVADDHAASVAEHLLSDAMFTGWGVRTLASTMGTYNPVSYHNGAVWPHDNALIVAGLLRYGQVENARRVATALVEVAAAFDGRLPELFCGFDRRDVPTPISYPAACSPQAWAATPPLALLAALLTLEPCLDEGTVDITNVLPDRWRDVRVFGLAVGDQRVNIDTAAP